MPNCVYKYYFHWRYEKKILQLIKQKDTPRLEKLFDKFVNDINDTGCSCILGYVSNINDLFMLTWGMRKYIRYMGVIDRKSVTTFGRSLFVSYLIKIYRLSNEDYLLDVLNSRVIKLSIEYIIKNYNHTIDRQIVNHNLYRIGEICFRIDEIPKIIDEKTLTDYHEYHKIRSIMLIRQIVKSNRLLSANQEMTHSIHGFLFG